MQCPGQDSRYWDGEAIFESKCPKCGNTVEFFKDDSKRVCRKCGHDVFNPKMDFGCASYCPYAEQCLGSMPPELLNRKKELLIDRVALEMKRYFDGDFKRIGRATRLARHAEKIADEQNANKAVAKIASYLNFLEGTDEERAAQAKELLTKLGANEGLTAEVCEIIRQLNQQPLPDSAGDNCRVVSLAMEAAEAEEAEKTPNNEEQA